MCSVRVQLHCNVVIVISVKTNITDFSLLYRIVLYVYKVSLVCINLWANYTNLLVHHTSI